MRSGWSIWVEPFFFARACRCGTASITPTELRTHWRPVRPPVNVAGFRRAVLNESRYHNHNNDDAGALVYRWKRRQGAGLTVPIVGLAVLRSTGSLESITSSDTLPVMRAEKKIDQGAQKHMNRCVCWVSLKSDGLQKRGCRILELRGYRHDSWHNQTLFDSENASEGKDEIEIEYGNHGSSVEKRPAVMSMNMMSVDSLRVGS
ncbi:hypothetical protein GE21DRAFT_1068346 [Neurospora crassa]|nr:hypothetical protein GE21DRAFT_1068346 [Neurospora crassa]